MHLFKLLAALTILCGSAHADRTASTCEKLLDPRTAEVISFLGFLHPAQENAIRNASSKSELLYLLHWSRGFTLPARSTRQDEDQPKRTARWANLALRRKRSTAEDTSGLARFVPGMTNASSKADRERLMTQANSKFRELVSYETWSNLGREARTSIVMDMVVNALALINAVDSEHSFDVVYPTDRETAKALRRLFLGGDIDRLTQMVRWTHEPKFMRDLLIDTEKVFPLLLARHNALTIPIPPNSSCYHSITDDPSLGTILLRSYLLQDCVEKRALTRALDQSIDALPPPDESVSPPSDEMTMLERDQHFTQLERRHTRLASTIAGAKIDNPTKLLEQLGRQLEEIPEADLRATHFIALNDALDKLIGDYEVHQILIESTRDGLSTNHNMILVNVEHLQHQLENLRSSSAPTPEQQQLERKLSYQDVFSRVSGQSIALAQASIDNDLLVVDQIRSFKTLVHVFAGQKANAPQTLAQIATIKTTLRELIKALSANQSSRIEDKE